jgi:geranylgeranyl pyrophosphate synthase/predicted secreted hydrolase
LVRGSKKNHLGGGRAPTSILVTPQTIHSILETTMASSPAVGFERPRPRPDARIMSVPSDWPGPGPIDLDVHDLPHASSTLEWWYVNTHVRTESGRDLSLFAAFFRQARAKNQKTGEFEYVHSITWALSDPENGAYHPRVGVDSSAPAFGLAKLDAGIGFDDERIRRALREVLERGNIPGPTRIFSTEPRVAKEELALEYGVDRLEKRADGSYELNLNDPVSGVAATLTFAPQKPPTRYGNDGVVHGVADELMFYYFIPRCAVSGSITQAGVTERVVEGSGWYDHEFGFVPKPQVAPVPAEKPRGSETSWRWLSLQLDGGTDVSVFIIRGSDGEILDNWTIVSDADGRRHEFKDARIETLATWRSTRSFIEYPTRFRLTSRTAGLSVEIEAAFNDQEVLTVISDPGFWEGRVSVRGLLDDRRVVGKGWLECKGYRFRDLGAFFNAVGAEVRERVASQLSTSPTAAQLSSFVMRGDGSRTDTGRYVDGVDSAELVDSLIRPIREIVDRGGKGWRSYAALACIDVVGGDSRKFLRWLALPEMLHVGSLIVDDVEDDSAIRRGEPSCHVLHGVPIAINAGTAAYFLGEPPVLDEDLPAEQKLRIYRLYFDAMRAGHAGQAIDLKSAHVLASRVAETGDARELEARVLALHRLKTAVPAGMLARMGAILGGGSERQIEELGTFFESVGLAFQIMDDVLNLRGFEGDLKVKGEDIRQGKLTLPVVKALGLLPRERRVRLWEMLRAQPSAETQVVEMIDEIERVGALMACVDLARDLVESAWAKLDPVLEDSQFKVMFRAFGWYVLDRHY